MHRRFSLSVFFSDLTALAAGIILGFWMEFRVLPWSVELVGQARGQTVWQFIGFLIGGLALSSYFVRRSDGTAIPRPSYGRAVAIGGLMLAFTSLGLVVTRVWWSRPVLVAASATFLVGALAHRAWRRRKPWTERMVIVTREKGLAVDIARGAHADVLEVLDPAERPGSDAPDPTVSLVVDLRGVLSEEMAQYVSSCGLANVRIRSLITVYEEHTGRLPMVHLAEGWELSSPVQRNAYASWKRLIDLSLVAITLPLWVALFGIIWVWVRLDSPGPVIYRQERLGSNGHRFTLYKFRTMVDNAEHDGPRFAQLDDARLTRSGRWLRHFRIDEIPQLWNVLRGDLSLVGPRPERPVFVAEFEKTIPFYGNRHLVRPGLTGWAQVNYGYADDEADTIDKLTYDLYYVKHMSAWLDLQILGRSIWTVLSGFGAR